MGLILSRLGVKYSCHYFIVMKGAFSAVSLNHPYSAGMLNHPYSAGMA